VFSVAWDGVPPQRALLPPEVVDYDSLAFKVWRVLPAWGRWVLRFLLARSSSWGCLSKPVRD